MFPDTDRDTSKYIAAPHNKQLWKSSIPANIFMMIQRLEKPYTATFTLGLFARLYTLLQSVLMLGRKHWCGNLFNHKTQLKIIQVQATLVYERVTVLKTCSLRGIFLCQSIMRWVIYSFAEFLTLDCLYIMVQLTLQNTLFNTTLHSLKFLVIPSSITDCLQRAFVTLMEFLFWF